MMETSRNRLSAAAHQFFRLLVSRFPNTFSEGDFEHFVESSVVHRSEQCTEGETRGKPYDHNDNDDIFDEGDDDDPPVVVDQSDIDASMSRSIAGASLRPLEIPIHVRRSYPLLVASMAPNEDIVMTCARILGDALDVSLVREAAAYLEAVEQRKQP